MYGGQLVQSLRALGWGKVIANLGMVGRKIAPPCDTKTVPTRPGLDILVVSCEYHRPPSLQSAYINMPSSDPTHLNPEDTNYIQILYPHKRLAWCYNLEDQKTFTLCLING